MTWLISISDATLGDWSWIFLVLLLVLIIKGEKWWKSIANKVDKPAEG